MTRRLPLDAVAPVIAIAVAITLAPTFAVASDPQENRVKVLQALKEISEEYQEQAQRKPGVFGGKPGAFVQIPSRKTPIGDLRSVVQVAARKWDPVKKTAGAYVSFTGHEWGREEYFVLCFRTANPVYFSLDNIKPGPGGVPTPYYVLPSRELPESEKPIKPGERYEFTNPLQTEDHGQDEVIRFVFTESSNPKVKDKKITVFAKNMQEIAADLQKRGAHYMGLEIAPPARTTSDKFEDVAIVVGATDTSGILELTLRKKK